MVTPIPSATVVVLREGAPEWEVLLVRRSAMLDFHGGSWVFPGGRIDPTDLERAGSEDLVLAARHAAVRELAEEAGMRLSAAELVPMSRWTTPPLFPKRFITWFFLALAGPERVEVDGGEIVEHRWLSPARALRLQREGELGLPHPTLVTLTELSGFPSVATLLDTIRQRPLAIFAPELPLR